jgi:two-component system cell cycle response regulator
MVHDRDETRVTKLSAGPRSIPADSCLVVIYGPDLGKRISLDQPEMVVGRDRSSDVVIELDNVSRRHCSLRTREGKVFLRDLNSTNGTYLNDEEVVPPVELVLRGGDLLKVGGAIFKFLNGGNVESLYHEEIYRMTIIDGLTEVHNKRYFMEFLEREMARCHRYGRSLSLMMVDIDHFKRINDEYGHLAGDHVLRELAGLIKAKIRKEELIARFGGEEFAIVMPESGADKARKFAEKLRAMVAAHEFSFESRPIKVSISAGAVDMSREMSEPPQFIKAADANLLAAKRLGRNRVVG